MITGNIVSYEHVDRVGHVFGVQYSDGKTVVFTENNILDDSIGTENVKLHVISAMQLKINYLENIADKNVPGEIDAWVKSNDVSVSVDAVVESAKDGNKWHMAGSTAGSAVHGFWPGGTCQAN